VVVVGGFFEKETPSGGRRTRALRLPRMLMETKGSVAEPVQKVKPTYNTLRKEKGEG